MKLTLGIATVALLASLSAQSEKDQNRRVYPAPTTEDRVARDARSQPQHSPVKNTNRIVGGEISKGRPFAAALLYEKDGRLFQYCGASVVGDRWLLTAAHCDVQKGETVIVNRANLQTAGGRILRVENVVNHESYQRKTHDNDIAVIRVSADIPKDIPRVRLGTTPETQPRVLVAGWGLTTEGGTPSLRLREVEVPLIASGDCQKAYGDLTDNMLCAGEKGKDSCQGDSGGPLFRSVGITTEQYGIVSYGKGCGRDGYPGVYTRVDRYTDFVTKAMK